ncbi:MAG: hypothetical protein KDE00_06650 [Rhodobacteraceae bacterium]|nr:hypothetical protein [Paracoccaceae bacterium]
MQAPLPPKLHVEGSKLVYDSETGREDGEIEPEDSDALLAILRETPGITTLALNSAGGSIWAAEEMSRIVIDFDLDTVVEGECSSSCVTVFLGGKARSMARGSKIGLHSRWWAPEDVEGYYERNKEEEHWATPFEFGSWIYEDTQAEIYEALSFLVARGVDPAFAIEMHAPRDTMWYPSRSALQSAGVLRD